MAALMASSCNVTLTRETFRGVFTVEGFDVSRDLKKVEEHIQTPVLVTTPTINYHLRIYPNGANEAAEGAVSIYMYPSPLCKGPLPPTAVRLGVSVLGKEGETVFSARFDRVQKVESGFMAGWPSFRPWNFVKERCLVGGNLTLRWDFEVFGDYEAKPAPRDPKHLERTLAVDMGRLLETGVGSDVEVVSRDGRSWSAHRAVLMARSDVFARMFAHQMKESSERRVEMTDADGAAVDLFLTFLYTGTVPEASTCAELLPLAKKYEVGSLVEACTCGLLKDLTVVNAAERLRLADALDVMELKAGVLEFVLASPERLRDVQDSEAFDALDKDLLREFLAAVTVKRVPKRPREEGSKEFADGSDWGSLSLAQLRRACGERSLATSGNKSILRARLTG